MLYRIFLFSVKPQHESAIGNFILFYFIHLLIYWLHGTACRIPNQGSNQRPLHWKCRALTTEPSGKSHLFTFLLTIYISSWEKWLFKSFVHLEKMGFFFLLLSYKAFKNRYSGYKSLIRFIKNFLPYGRLSFCFLDGIICS